MRNSEVIHRLKSLIENYESELERYNEMVDSWVEYDDPGCDPGLQYEQEVIVENSWNELVDFCNKIQK
jgi:hypothetical protein